MNEYTINTKYGPMTGTIETASYGDGSLAVTLNSDEGPERLSLNLAGYGITAPEGHFWVKNYGGHEGMAQALADAGIARFVEADEAVFGDYNMTATLMLLIVGA